MKTILREDNEALDEIRKFLRENFNNVRFTFVFDYETQKLIAIEKYDGETKTRYDVDYTQTIEESIL